MATINENFIENKIATCLCVGIGTSTCSLYWRQFVTRSCFFPVSTLMCTFCLCYVISERVWVKCARAYVWPCRTEIAIDVSLTRGGSGCEEGGPRCGRARECEQSSRQRDVSRGGSRRVVLVAFLSLFGRALQVSPRLLCVPGNARVSAHFTKCVLLKKKSAAEKYCFGYLSMYSVGDRTHALE